MTKKKAFEGNIIASDAAKIWLGCSTPDPLPRVSPALGLGRLGRKEKNRTRDLPGGL